MNGRDEIEQIKSQLDQISDLKLITYLKQLLSNYETTPGLVEEQLGEYGKSDTETANLILETALNLNVRARADLVQRLLDSLDQMELEAEWYTLAETRLSELESGKTKPIGWIDIKQRVTNGS